jgi:ubiquinol-cytochrome c reductase iron-sulfur subunit
VSDRPDGRAPWARWGKRWRLAKRVGKATAVAGVAVGAGRALKRRGPDRDVDKPLPLPHERSSAVRIGLLFLFGAACGIGLLILYALGGQIQLEGLLLGGAFLGIGAGLILWGEYLFPHEIVTEERGAHASDRDTLLATQELIGESEEAVTRRRFLVRMLGTALGALAAAFIFPIRSLGPNPGNTLFTTRWRKGLMVVDEEGNPVRADTLLPNGVVTVFPQGFTGAADSAAILVKVDPIELQLPPDKRGWAPDGNLCYSKICTHAGCPVGLYLAAFHELQCPCHQSAFNVLNGAEVVFGPAPRALPQLQIYTDGAGFLRAAGDFSQPVGPGFWDRPSGEHD